MSHYDISTLYDYENDFVYSAPSYHLSTTTEEAYLIKLKKNDVFEHVLTIYEHISNRLFGSVEYWDQIMEFNPLLHPSEVTENTVISIPVFRESQKVSEINYFLTGDRRL